MPRTQEEVTYHFSELDKLRRKREKAQEPYDKTVIRYKDARVRYDRATDRYEREVRDGNSLTRAEERERRRREHERARLDVAELEREREAQRRRLNMSIRTHNGDKEYVKKYYISRDNNMPVELAEDVAGYKYRGHFSRDRDN